MNNLESPTGLKQRLIKALGGYNLLDPRSPSQIIARTPINLNKKVPTVEPPVESLFETTLDISAQDDDPYRIFEEEQPKNETSTDELAENTLPIDPRSPCEYKTPIARIEETDSSAEPKADTKNSRPTMLKTMYKDLVRRDPIYRDLLHEDDDDATGKTTPVKKVQERTPLGCLVNKNLYNSTPIRPMVKNEFADCFVDKIERPQGIGIFDENTPVGQSLVVSKTQTHSKSRIPIRARRLE